MNIDLAYKMSAKLKCKAGLGSPGISGITSDYLTCTPTEINILIKNFSRTLSDRLSKDGCLVFISC